MRILGLDPSLSSTGWGIIEVENNRLRYVDDGFIKTDPKQPLPERLTLIHKTLAQVIELYKPEEAAIEQVFLNDNPKSTIKLGMARGVVILAPALYGIPVTEYEPTLVKKRLSVWGGRKSPRWKRWLKSCCQVVSPKIMILPMLWRWLFAILTTAGVFDLP